jgi:hypothetical protein
VSVGDVVVSAGGNTAGVAAGSSGFLAVSVLLDVPVVVWALTTTSGPRCDVVVDDVFSVASPVPGVSAVVDDPGDDPADGVDFEVVGEVPVVWVDVDSWGVTPPAGDGSDGVVFEDSVSVASANATPCPIAIAVPTPNATASPPTRPMYRAEPMISLTSLPPTSVGTI